jgi:glucarate dehydratase
MRIVDVRATTVAVPLEVPLRHANGAHWGRFVRTIVEIEADHGANLPFAADAHYHHLVDDILQGGKIAVPKGPGLGVELDRAKLEEYAELYRRTGGYPYDRDPERPDWFAIIPESRFALPKNTRARPARKRAKRRS